MDRKSSNLACTLSGHGSWVLSVDFALDQQHFVSSSSDHTVKVWDFAQRNCVHTFKDHHDQVGMGALQVMAKLGWVMLLYVCTHLAMVNPLQW